MKLLVTFIGVIMSVQAFSQRTTPAVKDDTIIITSTLSGDSLFTEIGKRLVRSGFTLSTTNREFGQIATAPKVLSEYNFSYSLMIVIDGSRLEIKPTVITDTILGTYRWYYIKGKGTKNYVVMEDIMKAINGLGEVTYDRKG